jgi:hypothetical protein
MTWYLNEKVAMKGGFSLLRDPLMLGLTLAPLAASGMLLTHTMTNWF